jgi:hypothetical protein
MDERPSIRWHTTHDLVLMAEHGIAVAHCPSPFARYGEQLRDFGRYRRGGVRMAMGDGCRAAQHHPGDAACDRSATMMLGMRTTLTIDDDLAGLLKQRARELGIPFKEMVGRTLRAGFEKSTISPRGVAPKTIPHSFGFRPGVDLDKLNQLADELEAEGYAPTALESRDSARRQHSRSRP